MLTTTDWDSVPDWVAGVGTALAFLIAAALFGLDRAARRERAEQSRQAQARLVSVWTTEIKVKRSVASGQPSKAKY
jgi:hypothetical protein